MNIQALLSQILGQLPQTPQQMPPVIPGQSPAAPILQQIQPLIQQIMAMLPRPRQQPQMTPEFSAWRDAKPMRPDGGFGGDQAARSAFRDSKLDWREQRPEQRFVTPTPAPQGQGLGQPGVAGAQGQGHAWGHRFKEQFGMSPGKDQAAFKAFKQG
jgi:hypothetical protein